jgi:hypothetical protein
LHVAEARDAPSLIVRDHGDKWEILPNRGFDFSNIEGESAVAG